MSPSCCAIPPAPFLTQTDDLTALFDLVHACIARAVVSRQSSRSVSATLFRATTRFKFNRFDMQIKKVLLKSQDMANDRSQPTLLLTYPFIYQPPEFSTTSTTTLGHDILWRGTRFASPVTYNQHTSRLRVTLAIPDTPGHDSRLASLSRPPRLIKTQKPPLPPKPRVRALLLQVSGCTSPRYLVQPTYLPYP